MSDVAADDVSRMRLILMRLIFGGTFLFIGTGAWKTLLTHTGTWDPLHGVVWSFWAAYGTLMLLGVLNPLRLLPLLLLQLFYKLVWLATVGYPLWSTGRIADFPASRLGASFSATELAAVFLVAVVVDVLVIPWRYAFRTYARR